MRRMMSSLRPLGAMSCSMSVTNPYLYSVFASCSMTSVDVDMTGSRGSRVLEVREVLGVLGVLEVLNGKRLAAAARAFGVRIAQCEIRGHQVLLVVIQHGAVQQPQASRIDENFGPAGT